VQAPVPAAPPEVQVSQTVAPSEGRNTGKIIGIVLLILLVVGAAVFATLYFVVWSDSGTQEQRVVETSPLSTSPRTTPETAPRPEPEPQYGTVKVGRSQYEQAQTGMSYEQVQAIFGGPGARQSETGTPGQPGYTVEYAWDGDQSGSAVFCTFADNALTEKSNTGL
jgi:hypothetical protein